MNFNILKTLINSSQNVARESIENFCKGNWIYLLFWNLKNKQSKTEQRDKLRKT